MTVMLKNHKSKDYRPGVKKVRVDERVELRNIKRLFWQLLKDYSDGSISIIDRDFQVIYTGGELYKQWQTDPDDWIGKKIFPLFPPAMQKSVRLHLLEVFNGKSISDYEIQDSYVDGQFFAMDAFPLIEKNGTIKRAGVIIRNITRLKEAEESLKKALAREKELNELKSRFVSMASHEFRTPLSTILSSAFLISRYATSDDQAKRERHIGRIISSVNMLTDILNDFLSIGKIEEGKISVKPVNIEIQPFIESIIAELEPVLKKEQAFSYTHQGKDGIALDHGLLKHILLNLLSNAIKFSGENSAIKICTLMDDKKLLLGIKDSGIGIPPEDQAHLFERFFRGSNVSHIQGTGLGLHIVSRYVQLMNGKIRFKSELGKGTQFTIIFRKNNHTKNDDEKDFIY